MSKANKSKLFGSEAFRYPNLRGFPKKTSSRYLSVNNEAGRATLYRPALKALILYFCEGRKVWDETLTETEILGDEGVVSGLGDVGNFFLAEYKFSEEETHIACFDIAKMQFLFAGITKDNGETWQPYVLDYKEGRNGTVLWLALMPYLRSSSEELKTCFENLETEGFKAEFFGIVKGLKDELPKDSIISQCFIFCDNIYLTVDRDGFSDKIPVDFPRSGVMPSVPKDLTSYVPSHVIGNFTVKGLVTKTTKKKKKLSINYDSLHCMYALDENMSEEKRNKVVKMYPSYIVPKWVLKAAHNIKFHHDSEIQNWMKQKNLLLYGPPGGGKTEGAKAIASALGLEYTHISMSSNSDEVVFTGNIIPKVDGLDSGTSTTTSFGKYQNVAEMLEDAEMAPEIVFQELTGIEKSDATVADCVEAYKDLSVQEALKTKSGGNGISYTFAESEFAKGVEQGKLVIIEEFTNARDQAISTYIHQVFDGYQSMELPTGRKVKRHPNTVIVFASNVDEANTKDFETATFSRIKPMYYIGMPGKAEMIKRVKAMTEDPKKDFVNPAILDKMADVVIQLQKYINEQALPGVCGIREFAGWVLQYIANSDFEPEAGVYKNALSAAEETIVPSASPHAEDRIEIMRDVIDTMVTPSW